MCTIVFLSMYVNVLWTYNLVHTQSKQSRNKEMFFLQGPIEIYFYEEKVWNLFFKNNIVIVLVIERFGHERFLNFPNLLSILTRFYSD